MRQLQGFEKQVRKWWSLSAWILCMDLKECWMQELDLCIVRFYSAASENFRCVLPPTVTLIKRQFHFGATLALFFVLFATIQLGQCREGIFQILTTGLILLFGVTIPYRTGAVFSDSSAVLTKHFFLQYYKRKSLEEGLRWKVCTLLNIFFNRLSVQMLFFFPSLMFYSSRNSAKSDTR